MLMLASKVGLVDAIDERLGILRKHRPYRDSDHILNIAFNLLCGGRVLDDIEVRRNDTAFLDALGARTIPDPTTAGDFCRRFDASAVHPRPDEHELLTTVAPFAVVVGADLRDGLRVRVPLGLGDGRVEVPRGLGRGARARER